MGVYATREWCCVDAIKEQESGSQSKSGVGLDPILRNKGSNLLDMHKRVACPCCVVNGDEADEACRFLGMIVGFQGAGMVERGVG